MAANPDDLFQPVQIPVQAQAEPVPVGAPPPAPATLPNDPVQAVTRTVQPLETVQGQLNDLFEAGNPLMVQAREGAQRTAAGRGLQNSSIAAQAGEQALFSSAMPIATQDANAYGVAAGQNQQAQNTFGLTERQGQITSGLSSQEFQQQGALNTQQGQINSQQSAQDWREQMALTGFEGTIASGLSEQQFNQALETAKQKFGFDSSLSAQESLQRLVELAKQGDIQAQLELLKFGHETSLTVLRGEIAVNQSNVDSANRLLELAKQGDIQASLDLQRFGFDLQLSAQENLNRLAQIAATGDVNAQLQLDQFTYQTMLNDQNAGIQLQLEDQRFQQNQDLVLLEYAQRGVLSTQEAQAEMDRLNQQHANTLEQIAAQVAASTSADAAAAGRALQNNYLLSVADRQRAASQEIAQIYQTEGLTAAQQNTAVQNAYNRMMSDISLLSSYYASSPLWDPAFETTPPTTSGTGNTITPTDNNGALIPPDQQPVATTPSAPNLMSEYLQNAYASPDDWGGWDG